MPFVLLVFRSNMWKLIIDGAMDGARNMAIDAALLEEVEALPRRARSSDSTAGRRPTISLGRNQKIDKAVDVDYCREHRHRYRPSADRRACRPARRRTHLRCHLERRDCFGDTIYGNYKRVSEALCLGYNRLGVPAVLAPETRKPIRRFRNGADPPCFLSPSRYELMVEGRKIVGSAQRRVRRSFLQHGSMPITCNREALARATRHGRIPQSLETEMAGMAEFLAERPVDGTTARGVLCERFRTIFRSTFVL